MNETAAANKTAVDETTADESVMAETAATLPVVVGVPEGSLAALARGSVIHCRRLLLSWARMPATTIQSILYPTLTLLMFRVAFGDAVSASSGQSSVYGTVPMITLVAAMSGAVVSGFGLTHDGTSGLLSRFTTLPVHRAAGLVGRLMAEGSRVLLTTLLMLAVGACLGFRFGHGIWAALALVAVPVMFGLGFAILVTSLATVSNAIGLINLVTIFNTLLMFFNSGFVPVHDYPSWLQGIVANQPMSCAIEAMRGLSAGGPVAGPLWKTVAWSVGLVAVFAWPAVRGIERAARRA